MNKGDQILIKATIKDLVSNPNGAAIMAQIKGDPNLTHSYALEVYVHIFDREHILLCPTFLNEITNFTLAMEKKLNDKENIDTWNKLELKDLINRLKEKQNEFYRDPVLYKDTLIDIANLSMLLYARTKKFPDNVSYYCDICNTVHVRREDGMRQYCPSCDSGMERK